MSKLHNSTCTEHVTCGSCGLQWCEKHDPAPSALCHRCHGRGYTTAPWDRNARRGQLAGERELERRIVAHLRSFGGES